MNIHNLDGCSPAPLAHYLKALGILRLVAEQKDPEVRGWWEGEHFRLATVLDRDELEGFFLEHYEPTPVVSPWNKGSGFYYENDPALKAFELSPAGRANHVRDAIGSARLSLSETLEADELIRGIKAEGMVTKEDRAGLRREMGIPRKKGTRLTNKQKAELKSREAQLKAKKKAHAKTETYKRRLAGAERKFKQAKADILRVIRLSWRGRHRSWMDAAMVLGEDGKPRYPALLGTGGNDGRLDFTNNFFQRINEIFDLSSPDGRPRPEARMWLTGALWGAPVKGCQPKRAVGQYLPGMAGGANSNAGPEGNSLLNPFDFVLMMEGTISFTVHMTRRLGIREQARVAAPFAVSGKGAGYASAGLADEGARGEQWMPLWSKPLTYFEFRYILKEGRMQLGKDFAGEPLDVARAVARLGSARGISAFERYTYVERNGQSNLAVPIGRFRVPDRISPSLSCLDDLDGWLGRLRVQVRSKNAPESLQSAERRLSDALFAVTRHPDEFTRWQAVLLALVDIEAVMRTGGGFRAGPVPPLRPEWAEAANDGSPEFRLALACALQSPWDPLRRHWLPLKEGRMRFATAGSVAGAGLERLPEVVMEGRAGLDDAIALVQRRILEAGKNPEYGFSLVPARGASACVADLALLLAGGVNLDLTMKLARALMALNRKQWGEKPRPINRPDDDAYPDDAWLAVRLTMSPYPLPPEDRPIPLNPAITRRLQSGDAASAVASALQRLRSSGIETTVRFAAATPEVARLWLAALAFPVHKGTAAGFLRRLTSNT